MPSRDSRGERGVLRGSLGELGAANVRVLPILGHCAL